MRTTLDIDEDVLNAAKDLARREKKTAGQVLSELARQSLTAGPQVVTAGEPKAKYGFRPIAKHGVVVTNERIDNLREDDVY